MDESFLTGETDRRVVRIGDRVYAGMLNGDGQLQVQVDAVGRQTLLSEIETLIDNAVTSKSRYVQVADRVARRLDRFSDEVERGWVGSPATVALLAAP